MQWNMLDLCRAHIMPGWCWEHFLFFHILVMLSLTQAESGGLLRVIMEDHMVGS